MQIKNLRIDNHLCLVDFNIQFETNDGGSSTIIIGDNGSGKSTMIEAILEILVSFDSPKIEKDISYSYEIEYNYAEKDITITKEEHRYRVVIDEVSFEGSYESIKSHLTDNRIFPKRIISFYSGSNDKLKIKLNNVTTNYKKKCRKVIDAFLEEMSSEETGMIYNLPDRKYLYCDENLTSIYLAAILCGNHSYEKDYLKKCFSCSKLESIDMVINVDKAEALFGRGKFEGDQPTGLYYLSDYIDYRFTDILKRGFIYSSIGKSYFTLSKIDELEVDSIAIYNYFEKLHLLFDAYYEVTVIQNDNYIKCKNLSEGQRQIIKVLGMLGVCKSEDCLVLMDEPDAHMNPKWKYEIKDIIDEVLKQSTNTQALIATHDPLVINGVSKEFIRIFERNNETGFTKVIKPESDTEGMGIDGLLQSEYYGLRTSYDKKATQEFEKRQILYEKLINNEINDEEKEELRKLTKEISSMPISTNSIDFLYDDFIRVFRKMKEYKKEYLAFDEIQERNKKIKEIIQALFEGQV